MKNLIFASLALPLLAACPGGDDACEPTAGVICTLAGSSESGYDGDEDIVALEAKMSLPMDTLTDDDGTVYVLDWNNHRIRKVDLDGMLRHVAGRGELGGTLDDPANDDFNHPTGMTFDPSGQHIVVAAWHNSKIRTLDLASGDIVDTCGDGRRAYFGDGGPAAMATLDLPASVAYDADGNLIVMDQANQVLRMIDGDGNINRIAGNCVIDSPQPAGPGPCPDGTDPLACAAPSGKTTCGDATTCMLPCNPGYNGDEILALDMRIAQPFGQSADPAGRIVIASNGDIYFADTGNSLIRMISAADGLVHRIAGTPPVDGVAQFGYDGDGGPATDALLNNPVDLALADDGTLYFTDVYNHCVRAIDPAGTITTVVGVCDQAGYSGDGGPATEALLKRAYGLELDGDRLLISDTGNNVIRVVGL
jgi:DNA-binding beta-propeller fold protein YncE